HPPRKHRKVLVRAHHLISLTGTNVLEVFDTLVYALVGLAFLGAALLALIYSFYALTNNIQSDRVSINAASGLLQAAVASGVEAEKLEPLRVQRDEAVSHIALHILDFVSDLLLVLIIMEVLGTVRSYLKEGDASVRPFLFIGIISATRGILSIGARLSIAEAVNPDEFHRSMIELAVNAVVILAIGLTIRVMGHLAMNKDEPEEHAEHAA
ncbi:MAG: phosphate-starvation-inducible PsiE family protein, partial [Candidatus Xenobia bacterium]